MSLGGVGGVDSSRGWEVELGRVERLALTQFRLAVAAPVVVKEVIKMIMRVMSVSIWCWYNQSA